MHLSIAKFRVKFEPKFPNSQSETHLEGITGTSNLPSADTGVEYTVPSTHHPSGINTVRDP